MALPGEVVQAIGHAYQLAFIGALEASIKAFSNLYDVRSEPEKVSFKGRNGTTYSFDFAGAISDSYHRREVFGESKGYSDSNSLLSDYRSFLVKAYVASTDHERHRDDLFWFVTNTPFACSVAKGIRTYEFLKDVLKKAAGTDRGLLGNGDIDDDLARALVPRLGVFIFTDSFLLQTEIVYQVRAGESMWAILKKLHGGNAPPAFRDRADAMARLNNLPSADEIRAGQRLRLRWPGLHHSTQFEAKF